MIGYDEARAWIAEHIRCCSAETVRLACAGDRVLAASLDPMRPGPARAALDGFAVAAAATAGASDYAPLPLHAVAVVAGAALPAGTDAVLPPHAVEADCALAAVAPGEGVAAPDPLALTAGTLLGPGALAALALRGAAMVEVVRRPLVRLVVAGPKSGPDALKSALGHAVAAAGAGLGEPADLVLRVGRSGAGPDDDGIAAFDTVFAHGVRVRPGETVALGTVEGRPALLLPGAPLDCLVAFALFAAPALAALGGRPDPAPTRARLGRKLVSGLGQVDAIRVVVRDGIALQALPSLAATADGLVLVAEGSEGYQAGADVDIWQWP